MNVEKAEIMEQENIAIYKLNEAREKLNLLRENIANLDVRCILELASKLRNNVCSDLVITDCCNSVERISDMRKDLLDEIRYLQIDIIEETIKNKTNDITRSTTIVNFDEAKISLSKMIEAELRTEMFSENEEPHLFDKIEDCKVHLSTLHRVNDTCQNDKYNILIMGDFQSGKSTTLDAICDGRHISAIGNGTATSAVLISVTYAEDETMNVVWRTKEQFNPIFDRIRKYLPNFNWDAFDLDDEEARKQLVSAIDVFRKSKDCPSAREGDAKFLMLSDFVLHFYRTSKLKDKIVSLQSISDISDITKFPKNGEIVWKESGMCDFSIDDAIFVFVERVECYIRSNTLKKLNCTVVDSPGLFNSSYDTMVTEAAMIKAHAIMYVLPYHKGISEEICESLYTIRDNYKDIHSKLFIVNNLRSTDDNFFYDSNCELIHSMFGPEKKVYRYDAKLSYLAQLRKSYVSEGLVLKDYAHFLKVKKKCFSEPERELIFTTFEDAWFFQMRNYIGMSIINADNLPDQVLEESGFVNLISELKLFIAENKAYAVILSNGINPMTKELKSIRNSLIRLYIEPFSASYDDLVKLWDERLEKAEKIQAFMLDLVKEEFFGGKDNASLCERLSDEESLKLFTSDFYKDLANGVSEILYDNKVKFLCTKTLFELNKDHFKQRVIQIATPLIHKKIVDIVSSKICYLLELIGSEQDTTIKNLFYPVLDKVEEMLKNEWNFQYKNDENFVMKDYLEIHRILNVSKGKDANESSCNTDAFSSDSVDFTLLGGLVTQITIMISGIAAMIAGYVTAVFCDFSGGTFLLAVMLGLGGLVLETLAPHVLRNKFVKILSKQILPRIVSGAAVAFKEIVKKQITIALNRYVDNLQVDIQKMKNERDLVLTPNPNKEYLCFRAIESIVGLDKQIEKYDEYKQKYIQKKSN